MKLDLTLRASMDDKLLAALMPDIEKERKDRSVTRMKSGKDGLTITIEAKDTTSMMAAANSVLKIIRVYETAKEATEK